MNQNDFITHIECLYINCLETLKAKNSDYSNDNSDPFHNFKLCEHAFGIPTEIGIMVRLSDKVSRAGNLIQKSLQGKASMVKDESLLDAIEDAINYLAILHAFIQSKDTTQPSERVAELLKDIADQVKKPDSISDEKSWYYTYDFEKGCNMFFNPSYDGWNILDKPDGGSLFSVYAPGASVPLKEFDDLVMAKDYIAGKNKPDNPRLVVDYFTLGGGMWRHKENPNFSVKKIAPGGWTVYSPQFGSQDFDDVYNAMLSCHQLFRGYQKIKSDDDSELTERMIEQAEASEAPEYNSDLSIEDLFKFDGKRFIYKDTDNFYVTPSTNGSYKCHYLVDLNQRFVSNWDWAFEAMIECDKRFKEYQKRIKAE